MLEEIYALKIGNQDFYPHFREGWTIYLQKGVEPSEFKDEDFVIYCQEDGKGVLRQISMEGSKQVILKALCRGEENQVIPRDRLKLCDKVINIRLN